jgi:TrmH family RNA methyltransferase
MLSKNRIRLIRSLEQKKGRENAGLFIAEGDKICTELISSNLEIHSLYYTHSWLIKQGTILQKLNPAAECHEISDDDLGKISLLTTPNQVLALVRLPALEFTWEKMADHPVLLLDQVQDPGNLGTIIRTADWFGFRSIVTSPGTVDCYHPKVVQAAMGSIWRIACFKADLLKFLERNRIEWKWTVYAAVMNGKNIFNEKLVDKGFYIFGNEAVGIGQELLDFTDKLITIPDKPMLHLSRAESLNVAIAASLVMAEQVRQQLN